MKKWIVIALIILLSGVASSIYSLNSFPKLVGNQVHTIKIVDMDLNVLVHWSLLEDKRSKEKDSMITLLGAFTYGPITERNYNPPSYWIQIGVKNGSTIDYLVWLENDMPATYVHGTHLDYKLLGIGKTAAYPIDNEIRDDILRLISK